MPEINIADPRAEAIIAAYQQVVMQRLDEGLKAIQASALEAMGQIAAEVWGSSGAEGPDVQKRILASLSRDQVIHGMMTTTDERFQSLSTRIADIDSGLSALSSATGELRAMAISGVMGGGSGGEGAVSELSELKQHMAGLESHLEAAFGHLAERDQQLFDSIRNDIKEETAEAIGQTNERVAEIEQYVKGGANAMGHLVRAVQDEVKKLRDIAAREIASDPTEIAHVVEAKMRSLAQLVRSDSNKLAELIREQGGTAEGGEGGEGSAAAIDSAAMAQILDARLGRMSELVSATTMSAVNEVARQVPEVASKAMQGKFEELQLTMDRSFVQLSDSLEAHGRRSDNAVVERTAAAVQAQIGDRLGDSIERMNAAVAAVEQAAAGAGGLGEAAGEDLADMLDSRLTALAKLIRSDNKAMAEVITVAAEQQAAKQATRAVKELAATLPAQILDTLDRRFAEFAENMHRETQSTVTSIAKSTDVLASRMDRVGIAIGQQYDEDMQRLGDAVAALVVTRRGAE